MAHYEASQSQKILQCLQNGKYSDINIKVNGDIIPAHKARFNFILYRLYWFVSNFIPMESKE